MPEYDGSEITLCFNPGEEAIREHRLACRVAAQHYHCTGGNFSGLDAAPGDWRPFHIDRTLLKRRSPALADRDPNRLSPWVGFCLIMLALWLLLALLIGMNSYGDRLSKVNVRH